jgi:hypothetical protein
MPQDEGLGYALFLATYNGYTLNGIMKELDENQFQALLDRVETVHKYMAMKLLSAKL